jgi:DNA-binding CsgD family transcriptional regulator
MFWRGRPSRMTANERAALSLAAAGLGVTEVAEALNESPHAVRGVLASAVRKLGARSKLEAVLIALQTGEIDQPTS